MTSATSTDYANPYRPWPIKLFNKLPAIRPDAAIFHPDKLISYARKKTGETEWSDAPLAEPLEHLCRAIVDEANLSMFGRVVQETRLKTLLVNRLRLDALMRTNPEILAQPTPDVILIAGLARTGTTLLHRTLAADPDARSLASWEALNPAPFPNENSENPTARIKRGESATGFIKWLAPDFSAVHPVSPLEPEEDILLLDLAFMSQTAEAVMNVPSYSAWLEQQDHRPAYAYLRDVLKTLNWISQGKYWTLKTPHHSEQLAAIMDIFPEATLIQTHRDPMATLASCCSLMAHSQALSTDAVNPHAIGQHWLRKVARMAEQAEKARQNNPDRQIIDIHYRDLLAAPKSIIASIYEARGTSLSGPSEAAIDASLARPRPHAARRHAYHLSDFGLTPQDIEQTFAPYCKQYEIPRESDQT